jgi:hypothetical protein
VSDPIGGKASGLLALKALRLPIPQTAVVAELPESFPEFGSDRVIIRPSERGVTLHDAVSAQSVSGALESVVADATSWPTLREHYAVHASPRIASFVLQPYVEADLGVMGHTSVREALTFIAVAYSLVTLAQGGQEVFEAVIQPDQQRFFTRSSIVPDRISDLLAHLFEHLPLLLQWKYSDTVEWEAALRGDRLFFLQAQASTAEIPDWSR